MEQNLTSSPAIGNTMLAAGQFLSFNLNDKVYVKLKEEGFVHYMNEWNKCLPIDKKQPLQYFKEKADSDGYVPFQFWEFIEMFGKTIRFGYVPIFETNVRFEQRDVKPCC